MSESEARKVAVLVMAHTDLPQLRRLLGRLQHPRLDVFVHVSSTGDITDSDVNVLREYDNVQILPRRYAGYLDDWSLCESVLALLEVTEARYSYYIKLSGACYPIKPINYILEYLDASYPKPLIDCTPFDRNNWIYHKAHVPRWYGFVLTRARSHIKHRWAKRALMAPLYVLSRAHDWLFSLERVAHREGIAIYGGSPMWILPDVAVRYVLECARQSNNKTIRLVRRMWTPEEIFFQTMVMQSPVLDLVEVNPADAVAQNCQTYNYFTDHDRPFTGRPYTFTMGEYALIESLPHLFARKFSTKVDTKVLDKIDSTLLN